MRSKLFHNWLFICLFWVFNNNLNAQYLNYVDTTSGRHEITKNYLKTPTGYISCGTTYFNSDYPANFRRIEVKIYDQNFNILNSSLHGDTLTLYQPYTLCRLGNYYYSGGIKSFDTIARAYIVRIDTLGNIINEVEFLVDYSFSAIRSLVTDGEYLFLGGNFVDTTGDGKVSVIKLDSLLNQVWREDISMGNHTQILLLDTASINGLILSTISLTNQDHAKSYIYKLDTAGNILWAKNYGTSLYWHILNCMELPDGTYFCYGSREDPINAREDSWFVKLDANGDFISDTIINNAVYDDWANHSFIMDDGVFVSGVNSVPGGELSYLSKFDFTGKHLWTRNYNHRTTGNYLTSYIDLQNGFHLFAGWVMFEFDDSTKTNDEWFLVLDEFGCDISNCNLSVTDFTDENEILIYPNPTNSIFTIDLTDKNAEDFNYQIYAITGNLIVNERSNSSRQNIDLGLFSSGIYFVKITSGDKHYTQKLILEK